MRILLPLFQALMMLVCAACQTNDSDRQTELTMQLSIVRVGTSVVSFSSQASNSDMPVDKPIVAEFSSPLNTSSVMDGVTLLQGGVKVEASISFLDEDKTFSLMPQGPLAFNTTYQISIGKNVIGKKGETFPGIEISFTTTAAPLELLSWTIGGEQLGGRIVNVPRALSAEFQFSAPLDRSSVTAAVQVLGINPGNITPTFQDGDKKLVVTTSNDLNHLNLYTIALTNSLKGTNGEKFDGFSQPFYTAVDPTPKFPLLTDDQLLTAVQQQTFKFFWDFGHSASGMARERNTSGNTVTSGGSGFGIMAMIVAMERNFISRQEGLDRLDKILDFLETADRFHGAWSHWIDGNTGHVIPFSANDNGGDLVETAFLMQGLLAFRQYLDPANGNEATLINRITSLWEAVEWDWYTQGGQNVLYWHWSPDKAWIMNHKIQGWNEALIIYVLAASSPTHSITASVYEAGWARNGAIVNGNKYYDITLPLGGSFGGPLFFAHYSFLGLDPRNLVDTYANYWEQNVAHSKINYAYCVDNPQHYVGYSNQCWGLTASDNNSGYSAHSPTNDRGVITPTAALSSFPYTPTESLEALKFFYYTMGDKTWGPYGFYDAFSPTAGWYGNSTLAIDQGPIIIMIENYRTGLLWDLFMADSEIQTGLTKLGFTY